MKQILILALFSFAWQVQIAFARTVEVEVYGMTCAFCVDSLQRKFNKIESVSKVEVSLKLKKIRLETDADSPSLEKIRKIIFDSGFTPTKVTVQDEEKSDE